MEGALIRLRQLQNKTSGQCEVKSVKAPVGLEYEAIEALQGMLENYIELKRISLMVAQSDAPNWAGATLTVEDDIHVIKARAILARATPQPTVS